MATGSSPTVGSQSGGAANKKQATEITILSDDFLDSDDLHLGTWNCGQTKPITKRQLTSNVLHCKSSNCHVVALQETRHSLPLPAYNVPGYTILCNEPIGNQTHYGLAFVIETSPNIKIPELVKTDHSRISLLRFEFKGIKLSFFNLYSRVCRDTSGKHKKEAEKCYGRLKELYETEKELPVERIIIIGGDMNAFPRDALSGACEPWVSRHVWGSSNYYGKILLKFLEETETFHLNSRFEKPKERKWTYKKSTAGGQTELDGFIFKGTDFVLDVDTYEQQEEVGHRMVTSTWDFFGRRNESIGCINAQNDALRKLLEHAKFINFASQTFSNSTYREFLMNVANAMYKHFIAIHHQPLHDILMIADESGDGHRISAEHPYSASDIRKEFDRFVRSFPVGSDRLLTKIIEICGGTFMEESTDMFNSVFDGDLIPEDWKRLDHNQNIPWLGCIYSNLLARKLNETFGGSYDIETERSEKSAEILNTLTLVIEAFLAADKPLHFAVIEYPSAYEEVRPSSVLDSLEVKGAPKLYLDAFTNLLQDVSMLGLHFGSAANYFLMDSTIKMIVENYTDKLDCENVVDAYGATHAGIEKLIEEFEENLSVSKESMNKTTKTEESVNPKDYNKDLVLTPGSEEASTSQLANTECRGIKIGDDYLNILHWDNKLVLIDTDIENINTALHDLSEVSRRCGLLMDYQHVFLVTTMFSDETTKLGDNEVKTVDARKFKLSYFESESCNIAEKLCDVVVMRKRFQDLALYVTMPEFRASKTEEEKLGAFKEKLIPSLFYKCESWTSTSEEDEKLQNYTDKILYQLGIKHFKFAVWKHLVHEKATWLKSVARRTDSICATLLNGWAPGDEFTVSLDRMWSNDLTSTQVYRLIKRKNKESKLISLIENEPEVWDKLIKKTKQV